MSTPDLNLPGPVPHSRANLPAVPPRFPVAAEPARALTPAGPSMGALLKALRRRWPLALSLALLGGVLAAGLAWYAVFGRAYTAWTLLQVDSSVPSLAFPTPNRSDFTSYQKTQASLVKSRVVIQAALERPEVAELETVRNHPNPVEWLERDLTVDSLLSPEILRVSLSGDKYEDLKVLVRAVTDVYLEEIVNKERNKRQGRLEQLQGIAKEYEDRLREKRQILRELAESAGSGDSPTLLLKQRLAMGHLGRAETELSQVQSDIRRLEADLAVAKLGSTAVPDVAVPESLLNDRIKDDPVLRKYLNRLADLEGAMAETERVITPSAAGRVLGGFRAEIENVRTQYDTRRDQLRIPLRDQLRAEARQQAEVNVVRLQERIKTLKGQENALAEEVTRLGREVDALNKWSLDVESLRDDIAQSEEVTKKVRTEVETLRVELQAPARVSMLQDVVLGNARNNIRFKGAALAGLGTFSLILFGMAWGNYRARRIESPEEVAYDMGIPLIGTVPVLPKRLRGRLLPAPDRPRDLRWHNRLIESVDSARTMLLRAARMGGLKVVMVSSAQEGEGKTFLSCHLAASLARTGRRVLLLDSDLRHPSVHRFFDLPLSPGFSELIRCEVESSLVLQRGPIPGLWVLAAGASDDRAVQALARGDSLQLVFDWLRASFDFVIVDSAPLLPVVDSLLVGQQVDGVILSVLRDVSRGPRVSMAYNRLEALGIPVLGAIVTGTTADAYGSVYAYAGPPPRRPQTGPEDEGAPATATVAGQS